MLHGEFRDERLVRLYDIEFPWSREDDFFSSELASEAARDVLDLGCGTGRLASFLSTQGYRVTGVDPAAASLEVARRKSGSVTWREGSYEILPLDAFDAALMTSHVAQFFGADFGDALAALARALRPGGRLIFDSRDPADRRWEKWNRAGSYRRTADYETWTEVVSVVDGAVTFEHHYVFADGDARTSTDTLWFRSEQTLRSMLAAAGFSVDAIFGGWNREPIGHPDGEFLVVARKETP